MCVLLLYIAEIDVCRTAINIPFTRSTAHRSFLRVSSPTTGGAAGASATATASTMLKLAGLKGLAKWKKALRRPTQRSVSVSCAKPSFIVLL